jgi:SPX domain protein involved in polyphosphate accumulation
MFRHELKYIINFDTFDALRKMLEKNCVRDANSESVKGYKIRSIYYDSPSFDFFWDKLDSLPFRRKIRVRFYGNESPEAAYLEIKEKFRGMIRKKRLNINPSIRDIYLNDPELNLEHLEQKENPVCNEVLYLREKFSLIPTIAVSYWRQAFVPIDGSDARITFDYDLQFLKNPFLPYQDEYWRNFFQPGKLILEVKIKKYLPRWLQQNLKLCKLNQTRYSKYCSALGTALPEILAI